MPLFLPTLPQYLKSTASEADQRNIELVLTTDDRRALLQASGAIKVDVLVADLGLLGSAPGAAIAELEAALQPELTVIVYAFATWELIESLRRPNRQLMRAPVSARSLRSSMLGVIVKHLTRSPATVTTAADSKLLRVEEAPPMHRFDDMQLAALQDVRSVVDYECPNQVADLVLALVAFENYSAQCKNRNEKDAQMHQLLARVTGHARAVMEYGLKELCAFENIDPVALAQWSARQVSNG